MALSIPLALGIVVVGISVGPIIRRIKLRDRPGQPSKIPQPPSPSQAVEPSAVIIIDRLERIAGMTSGVVHDLNQAGILTYADLAALSPERLSAIVNSTRHREGLDIEKIDVNDWIAQAQRFADHLAGDAPQPAP